MSSTTVSARPAVGAIPAQRTGSGKHAAPVPRPRPLRRRWLPASAPAGAATPAYAADAVAYLDFFYGFGAGPGVDLGLPKAHAHVPTASGCVFREDFERGIALANCGEQTAEVTLDQSYSDTSGCPRTKVRVAPRSVVVLTK